MSVLPLTPWSSSASNWSVVPALMSSGMSSVAVVAAAGTSPTPTTVPSVFPYDDDDDMPPVDSPLFGFNAWYQKIHGYLSLVVCTFGIVSNVMNIVVLTRRSMISPTNYLLTALAIADLLIMVFYVPNAAYFYCLALPDMRFGHAYHWIVYLLFDTNFNITAHTSAMWLTVSLAVFRYVAVCHPTTRGSRWCSLHRARLTVAAVVVATVVFCVPNYTMLRIVPIETEEFPAARRNGYWFNENPMIASIVRRFYYWLFGVALKVRSLPNVINCIRGSGRLCVALCYR